MWECHFNAMKKKDAAMARYVETHPMKLLEPLSVRDAFYGGRVSAMKLWAVPDLSKGETIQYDDIISLYPACTKVRN